MGKYLRKKDKKPVTKKWWFWVLIFFVTVGAIGHFGCGILLYAIPVLYILWLIYEARYFCSDEFLAIKKQIEEYTNDCNELNRHIEELKHTHLGDNRLDEGIASYHDSSKWNYKRKEFAKHQFAPNVHNCSRTVCDGARKEPFKYICKYFNIQPNEETLNKFEVILNNFEAARDGKESIQAERDSIISSISSEIPFLIRTISNKVEKELGFEPIDLSDAHYPKYIFQYVSSGGNASTQCDIVMDIENLNRFVEYLSGKIRFRQSIAGQRALMTSKLRKQIKERDRYTCCKCGASVEKEPHLLLEIDHIIPVSKGGLTTESNLQTLCWRCNRSKGAKMS